MAQAYLYAPMGDWITATTRCSRAALGDGAIVVGIAAAGAAVFRNRNWFQELRAARAVFTVVAGGSMAVLIEYFSLRAGRWEYGPLMPVIPYLRAGVVPVLQMMVLPVVVFAIVQTTKR